MESNNKNYGENQQQQKVGGKRKANDDQQPAPAAGEKRQPEKNRKMDCEDCCWNDDPDLEELEHLSREDLISIVRKQLVEKNAIAKQAEREKMEHHEDMRTKLAEITEMHKDAEAKSKELAEKDKQINALLIQLNESRPDQNQCVSPTANAKKMKIELSKETWFDMLSFVPRHQLGQIVPNIGRLFAYSIVQPFLHEYGLISLDKIWSIVAPYYEHPSDPGPRVRVCHDDPEDWVQQVERVKMADVPMPANIKNFESLGLSYFDSAVLNFIRKFQQNGLLDSVSLSFGDLQKYMVAPVLSRLLPLLNDIVSVEVANSKFMKYIYKDAGNSSNKEKEFSQLAMEMMEKPRILAVSYRHEDFCDLKPKNIDLYCRWLCQTPRVDGKPRVLQIAGRKKPQISAFMDRIKQDFQMATHPIPFFICIHISCLEDFRFQSQVDICLKNGQTNERFTTKLAKVAPDSDFYDEDAEKEDALLISRHPIAASKQWIDEMEKEVLDWNFSKVQKRTISLDDELTLGQF